MFLWQPAAGGFYAPCVDGDYDMAVIGHEYGHMIENRMIGKGFRRQGDHAGAMGESSGDLLGMEYLNEYRFVPVSGENEHSVGAYATGNPIRAIRNYDMSFPSANEFPRPSTYPLVNPLNFSDVAYDIVGEQVHADGEIWSTTNFDIRELFLDRYPKTTFQDGIACADGVKPVATCEGNRRWIQLMFDAYLLMPIGPSFLAARDAYLAADMIRFGGANQDILWRGFARRGFGQLASVTSNGDEQPIPSWESPLENEATLTFQAFDEAGNAVVPDRVRRPVRGQGDADRPRRAVRRQPGGLRVHGEGSRAGLHALLGEAAPARREPDDHDPLRRELVGRGERRDWRPETAPTTPA